MKAKWMRSVVAGAVALSSGCSMLFVQGPPDRHETLSSFECTPGVAAPILDIIAAGTFGLAGLNLLATDAAGSENGVEQPEEVMEAALISGAIAAVMGVSSIHGFGASKECRHAKTALVARQQGAPLPTPVTSAPVVAPSAATGGATPSAPGSAPAPTSAVPASRPTPAPTTPAAPAPTAPAPPAAARPTTSAAPARVVNLRIAALPG